MSIEMEASSMWSEKLKNKQAIEEMFQNGSVPSLQEVLHNREQRVKLLATLLERYPEATALSIKCNIPGPIKNNDMIFSLFQHGMMEMENRLSEKGCKVLYKKVLNLKTGPEGFILVSADAFSVKLQSIQLEEQSWGRLLDVDIFYRKEGILQGVSRSELNYPNRKCLICDQEAKVCAARRVHSVTTLQDKIKEILLHTSDNL
ncbi:holo-ACP synthase [Lutispora thermophila DSM 19022]|uniref:citrate lyase holo-[acyl-carrier protein] synthase n=2 Tax=Lutispora TaxID=667112 RepID=A0A1M6IDA8_9FIRM|nr:holo-ACP synthase [Lutispora thermophila DSM 19022]